ncbi:ATP-binding protein [Streptomyces ficellus]|uniref:ATP-binding protein n=1 Tax=Streptomyces ficellus TaxID=1977088 RepID=A0ABT7ZDF7_9ACTN|nr:ATP-binding protein [Streptomyces ficellus]MDN3297532.1 ATP-binding protein [Streptomyces ficellus]
MADSSMKAVGWARSFPVSGGVRAGRCWAREHLESLGWTESAPETTDDVLLTVSELITNAHVHARSSAQVVLTWDNRCLHVSVHDSGGSGMPTPRAPDTVSTGGRGLALVDALADHWHTHAQQHGKTITACFTPSGGDG